ncbi:ribbon-helix-helix domain-containing protein [Kineococcus sp. G2]|uniref:ribbon-helix-helix domain-containing protein n=1 Tax=Kineococcus sp. G2 TaxID=3127484 RepID=UPI00301BD39D
MRTTINLPDELYRDVRVRAAEQGRTVTSLIEEALRRSLAQPAPPASPAYRVRPLPPSPSGARSPEIDYDDNSALLDAMEGDDLRAGRAERPA